MKKLFTLSLLIFPVLLALLMSCQGVGKTKKSLVTITVGSDKTVTIKSSESMLWAMARKALDRMFSLSIANAQIPSIVADVRVTVSAADMESIIRTVHVAGLDAVSITIEAPNGSGRAFLAEGLNAAGAVAYQGQATTDLNGSPVSLTITLTAAGIPIVASTSPANGAVDVVINATVNATFSEAMDPATITPSTFTLQTAAGAAVTGTVSLNNATATFTPSVDLATNTNYTATITTGAKSLIGFPLNQNYAWTFTTGYLPDKAPPTFSGLGLVTNVSITSMQLTWSAATDDVTPTANIVYLIYQAATSGGEVYSSATYTTSPGATSYTATGLTPETTYYFVVRAKDEAGNINTNIVEKSSIYPVLHVADTGNDITGNGSQANPYRTITKALTMTLGNEGIFVAEGTYDELAGESFPLQLKPGTALVCMGQNHTTVIDGSNSVDAIYGDAGALIDNCQILPGSDGTAIDDNITPITITNVVIGVGAIAYDAIVLAADSTVSDSSILDYYNTFITVDGGNPTIKNNTITGTANSSDGIDVNSGNPNIQNNTITGMQSNGIYVSSMGSPIISNNTITNNATGIYINDGNAQISGNTISNNSTGIYVYTSTGDPVININNNSIFCNTVANLSSDTASAIDARYNSWDHAPPNVYSNNLEECTGLGDDICWSGIAPLFDGYGSPIDSCLPL